jgi:hypothetical protein
MWQLGTKTIYLEFQCRENGSNVKPFFHNAEFFQKRNVAEIMCTILSANRLAECILNSKRRLTKFHNEELRKFYILSDIIRVNKRIVRRAGQLAGKVEMRSSYNVLAENS